MNEHLKKALKEGCHEREQARTGVSPTEKTSTKEDLARAMAKSKSITQIVTNGHVGRKGKDSCCWEVFQCQMSCKVSKFEA